MGKGKRNRDRKKATVGRNAGSGVATQRAVPEMLANTPDSHNDRPRPGYLSEHARDTLDPQVNAWALLNMYLGLIIDLEQRIRPSAGRTEDVDHEDVARALAESLRDLQPGEFPGLDDNAAEFVGYLKPRWRGKVVTTIFSEVSKWIAETGYDPDREEWFTGAQRFVPVMVPAQHREKVLALLDHGALRAEAERVNAALTVPVPEFAVDEPEATVWFALAMRAYPVATVHAAAALAAWVHAQPGAVAKVRDKRAELGQRALDFLEMVVRAPGRDPRAAEEPEPVYVAPWEVRPVRDNAEPTGETVEVVYRGPPMTPWTACYLWATVLTNLREWQGQAGEFGEFEDGDSPSRVFLARAIGINARDLKLTDSKLILGPGVLSSMSLPLVGLARLDPPVKALLEFIQEDRGYVPTPGELGYQPYLAVHDTIRAGGTTAEEVLADKELLDKITFAGDELLREATDANGAILVAIGHVAPVGAQDVTLGQLGGYLTDYLRATVLPDEDAQFRTVLEQQVGWPDGNPPAGLIASAGPWFKINFSPSRTPDRDQSQAWCRWLVNRGWAIRNDPHDTNSGVWMAVPHTWAQPLWDAGSDLGCGTGAVIPWPTATNSAETRPSDELLRSRYGGQP